MSAPSRQATLTPQICPSQVGQPEPLSARNRSSRVSVSSATMPARRRSGNSVGVHQSSLTTHAQSAGLLLVLLIILINKPASDRAAIWALTARCRVDVKQLADVTRLTN